MNLRDHRRTTLAISALAFAAIALTLFVAFPDQAPSLALAFVKFAGTALLVYLTYSEKNFRIFTGAVCIVLICGLAAGYLLNPALLMTLIAVVAGGLAFAALLAPPRWKSASVLALRIVLVAVLLGSFAPLVSEHGDLGGAIGIWTMLAIFGAWRKLKPQAADWNADATRQA